MKPTTLAGCQSKLEIPVRETPNNAKYGMFAAERGLRLHRRGAFMFNVIQFLLASI